MDGTLGHWNWGVSIFPVHIVSAAHLNLDNHIVILGIQMHEGEPSMVVLEMDIQTGEILK
jgi:hypothetical protein